MNPKIDLYLADGCGRCQYYATPQCKVHAWTRELVELRRILLDCGLTEELKWSMPCYTWEGNNILILAAFKDFCSLNFFKGSLLQDQQGLLVKAGENTQAARLWQFTDAATVLAMEPLIRAYILEAIEVEKAGLKADYSKNKTLELPAELLEIFATNPEFKAAFEALTPGRQRGYNLQFTAAKQSKTRIARIEKYMPKIMMGKGWEE